MLGKIKVRFKVAWQNYRVGDEIWPPGTLRSFLLERGYVTIVDDAPVVESPTKSEIKPKRKARVP